MIRRTPFHERLAPLNATGLFSHWSGHLVSVKYQLDEKAEYFAVRNAAGLIDTSPLYTYRITGPDAERFLAGVLARDVRTSVDGQAQYTLWCDDDGHVVEDGVVFRHSAEHYWLTAAEPNLNWFLNLSPGHRVTIEDVSARYGSLAVQGPRARAILASLAPEVAGLGFFRHATVKIGGAEVVVSRTGYTGDLGYEVWVDADDAPQVFDAVWEAGRPHLLAPVGQQALLMLRIEAGLLLLDADFHSSRFTFTDADRLSPLELGLRWMLKDLGGDRRFVGRDAIRRELAADTSRWAQVGIMVDESEWDRLHAERGIIPPKDHRPVPWEMMLFDGDTADGLRRVGHTTSFMWSPVLQRHIGMARVEPRLAAPGSEVRVEITIDHRYHTVAATVARAPLFDPPRKTATP